MSSGTWAESNSGIPELVDCALLGDRGWMRDHATDPGVFIHSMASRGHPAWRPDSPLHRLAGRVAGGEPDPFAAADELLA